MNSCQEFLQDFIPKIQKKSLQVNLATWVLETTGASDAATLKAELDTELRFLFNDREIYQKLVRWDQDSSITDPVVKRQLNVLIRAFKPNMISKELLEKISQQEASLSLLYSNFRPTLKGKSLSENDIREILKKEDNVEVRKEAWEASKQIGKVLAPSILKLIHLRNEAAKSVGYSDYFTMQLDLQEVDEKWLFTTLDKLSKDSEAAYLRVIEEIEERAMKRFHVSKEELGPWVWSEPFAQEDPLDSKDLDGLVDGVDILEASNQFYQEMGLDVKKILDSSDNFERPGKNQHAFCINIDRKNDVRTLNNVKPTIKWLETILHELGHAVYEKGYSDDLPWLLREPPHMITTEAMALLAGRQAYRLKSLDQLIGDSKKSLKEKAEMSLKRRQLIFSRWVLVMTYFEKELYRNPDQDLNRLWWDLVEKQQKIKSPGSKSQCDWAAKYHIGLAPVYYFSYLLGELFASMLEESMPQFSSKKAGSLLGEKLFHPGNRLSWDQLIEHAAGGPLSSQQWLKQFS